MQRCCQPHELLSLALAAVGLFVVSCLGENNLEKHGCSECRDCEECVEEGDRAFCRPASHVYKKCSEENGDVYWFNSCDEKEEIIDNCPNQHAVCIDVSPTDAACECETNWEGDNCNICPGNWDPKQDCAGCKDNWDIAKDCKSCLGNWEGKNCDVCSNHWIDENNNCGTCPGNWDPKQDCNACRGNWEENKNCDVCSNHWIDENNDCGTCPGNWDAAQDCNDCIGHFDPAQDCSECRNGWTGPNCETCPEGWDPAQDCIENCGNKIITSSEECDDGNQTQWDGCNECTITEFQTNTTYSYDQWLPAIAMGPDGRFIVLWCSYIKHKGITEISGQRFNSTGTADGNEFKVSTGTPDSAQSPSVAISADESFVSVWSARDYDGDGDGVFGQRFDSGGNPLGDAFQINTYVTSSQWNPNISMAPNGHFVVVWSSVGKKGIFGQRFDADGNPDGSEFQVSARTDYSNYDPSVAMDSSGKFVVVWQYYTGLDTPEYIFGRRYDAQGTPIGDEFQINSYVGSPQSPAVAMNASGQFIVTWDNKAQEGDYWRVLGKRFDADGNLIGSEFQINSYETCDQGGSSVSMAPDGSFIIVWQNSEQYVNNPDVFGQRFDSDGSPIDSEFSVNQFTSGSQGSPKVAMSPDGRFVIVWSSQDQDGNGYGIFAQRYDDDGNPLGLLPWDHYQ